MVHPDIPCIQSQQLPAGAVAYLMLVCPQTSSPPVSAFTITSGTIAQQGNSWSFLTRPAASPGSYMCLCVLWPSLRCPYPQTVQVSTVSTATWPTPSPHVNWWMLWFNLIWHVSHPDLHLCQCVLWSGSAQPSPLTEPAHTYANGYCSPPWSGIPQSRL